MNKNRYPRILDHKYSLYYSRLLIMLSAIFLLSFIIGNKSSAIKAISLPFFMIPRSYFLIHIDFINFSYIGVDKQFVNLICYKNYSYLFQYGKDTKSIISYLLITAVLGTCKISVVVPALNEEKYIQKCLSSLRKQKFDEEFEIILVDAGSGDLTVEMAKPLADKIIRHRDRPVGYTRNLGAKAAQSEYVAFIDADTIASPEWLSSISKSLSHSKVVGVTGPTLPYDGSQIDTLMYRISMGWLQHFSVLFGLPHVGAANCAYSREHFLKRGGFNENVTLSEDLAFSLKIRHEGQLVYNNNMIAYTSTRRIKAYGYIRLGMFYILNDAIFALTKRSLVYQQVR